MNSNNSNAIVRSLPETSKAMLTFRKALAPRNINDDTEAYLLDLIEDSSFRSLLNATDNSESVEGNVQCDNVLAAEILRDKARKSGNTLIGESKLSTVARSINTVLRRYGMDRKSRRNTVGGQFVAEAAE